MKTGYTFLKSLVLLICLSTNVIVQAQCSVSIAPSSVTINCGDSVDLEALGLSSVPALSTDFNNFQLGIGWSTTAVLQYNNPCEPSLDGTPSAWYGNVPLPRRLETNAFDMSCGGEICFDLDYGGDDNNSNSCEDPDLLNEGVYVQYSVNGGASWQDIYYFQPTSNKSGPYYGWANYCFTIPPGAWSSQTRFRWNQPVATSTIHDHWGIDNVVITPAACGGTYDWAHIAGTNDPALTTVSPNATTDYSVTYSDSLGNVCTDIVTVTVLGTADAGNDGAITVCESDGTINLFPQLGGSPDAGGSWSDVTGSGALSGSTFDPLVSGPGVFELEYVADDGCSTDTSMVTVTVNPGANAGTNGYILICSSDTITDALLFAQLGGNPDPGGVWSGPVGLTYTYTVTATSPCPSVATATVIVEEYQFGVNVSFTDIRCYGETSDIEVSPLGGIAPYTGAGVFTELAGTYSYTITDGTGCSITETVIVTEPAPIAATLSATSIDCFGGTSDVTVTATGGTTPYSGEGTYSVTAGTHIFDVTDNFGCAANEMIVITQPTELVASATATSILCTGGAADITVVASGGTAPYTGTGTFSESGGTYSYTVTDANGCTDVVTITISESTTLEASVTATSILCNGGTADITVAAIGGSGPYTGTGTFTETAGTYTYTIIDDNGCSVTETITVTEPTQMVVSVTATDILCNGGTSDVTVTATGGTAPYTGTGTFAETAGTHTYIITDANGCTDTVSITVTEPSPLVVSTSAIGQAGPCYSANEAVNGDFQTYTGTVTQGNSWINNNLDNWSVSHGTPSANGNLAIWMWSYSGYGEGVYTDYNFVSGQEYRITYELYQTTDANPTAEFNVRLNNNLTPASSGNSVPSTAGTQLVSNVGWSLSGNTQTITETFVAGANYSQLWFYPYLAGGPTPNQAASTIDNIVIERVLPCASNEILCNGGTTDLTVDASGGTAPYTGTGTFTIGAGTHTYTVTDANNCSEIVTVTVAEPAALTLSISATDISCNGGTSDITVVASGGTAPYSGTGTFTESAGTYTYVVADSNGCTDSISITVAEPTQLSASATATSVLCNGGTSDITVVASGGTAPYTGDGVYTETAGTYTYTVTDANGCSVDVMITVTEPTQLTASASSTSILCNGGTSDITVVASGGTAPYTGTGVYTETAGTYTYTVTDANGCSVDVTITVTEPTQLTASASSTSILCNGGTSDITVVASGGTAPYTGTGVYTETTGTYTYTVTDANGCSVDVMITVAEPTQLTASASSTSILCNGGTSDITVVASGGTAPYSGTGVYTETAGTYTYTVTDANGCSVDVIITVAEPTQLSASASSTSILCNGGTSDITVVASGGTAPYTGTGVYTETAGTYTYTVTDANGCSVDVIITVAEPTQLTASATATSVLCNGGTSDITVVASGGTAPYTGTGVYTETAGTYTYTVTDANGCSVDVIITVIEPTQLTATASSTSILCNGGTSDITVVASGGTAPYTGTGVYTESAGTYTYTVTDANGCSVDVIITVAEPTQLSASATSPGIDCFGGSADVTVSASGGTAPYTGVGVFNETPGTYTYTVTDANGCSVDATITLTEPTLMTAYASCPVIDCFGGTADLAVFAFGGTAPYSGIGVFNVGAGTYTFTVTDANGCTSTVTHTVTEPPLLEIVISAPSIPCFGGSTDVTVSGTGGTAPYTGTGTFNVVAGTYAYSITDANGCTADGTITVDQPTEIEANVTPQNHVIDCIPIPVTLTANPTGGTGGPYTYLWSNGETTASIEVNPNTTTTYTVQVTDANGCTANANSNGTTITVLNRCGNNNQKVVICHVPHGNSGNPQTICISPNALNPHLSSLWDLHGGDYCGPCQTSSSLILGNTNNGDNTFIRAGVNMKNETIDLSYRIGYDSKVRLEIYDMTGTLVDVVHTAQASEGELYEFKLNANKLSSGVYIYQFITDSETHIDKLQIIQ